MQKLGIRWRRWIGSAFVASTFSAVVVLATSSPSTAAAVEGFEMPNRATGESANDYPDGSKCASGVAVDVTFGFVCSAACVTDEQCPESWSCRSIEQGNGDSSAWCFPRRLVPNN